MELLKSARERGRGGEGREGEGKGERGGEGKGERGKGEGEGKGERERGRGRGREREREGEREGGRYYTYMYMYKCNTCTCTMYIIIHVQCTLELQCNMYTHLYVSSTLISGRCSLSDSNPNWYWCSNALYSWWSQCSRHGNMLEELNPSCIREDIICLISDRTAFHFCCCLTRSVLINPTTYITRYHTHLKLVGPRPLIMNGTKPCLPTCTKPRLLLLDGTTPTFIEWDHTHCTHNYNKDLNAIPTF